MKARYLVGLALVALLGGCPARPPSSGGPPVATAPAPAVPCGVPAVDQPVTDFSFLTLDGQSLGLADLRGKVVVADFWAMQCLGCVEGLQHYQDDPELLKNPQVALVAFCMDKSEPAVRQFVKRKGWAFPVTLADDTARRNLGGEGRVVLPMVRVLDQQGRLRYSLGADQATPETVKCVVEHLLAGGTKTGESS
jgi:peroxiredoxin